MLMEIIKTRTIKQSVNFEAPPHEVYEALIDSKKHSAFTGDKAVISRKVSGKFSVFSRYLYGINIRLIKDKQIVQKWTCTDFPEGHYTKVTFSLAKTKKGTKLLFTQTEVPIENYNSISKGWHEYYWFPMNKMFEAESQKKHLKTLLFSELILVSYGCI